MLRAERHTLRSSVVAEADLSVFSEALDQAYALEWSQGRAEASRHVRVAAEARESAGTAPAIAPAPALALAPTPTSASAPAVTQKTASDGGLRPR